MTIIDLFIEQNTTFKQVIDLSSSDMSAHSIEQSKLTDATGTELSNFVSWNTDGADGKIIVELIKAQTSSLRRGVGHYLIDIKEPDNDVIRVLAGRVYVDGEL